MSQVSEPMLAAAETHTPPPTGNVRLDLSKPEFVVKDVPDPAEFLRLVPGSRVVEAHGVLGIRAPHNSDTVAAARRAGVEVPSAIRLRYNWPGLHKPYAHQLDTCDFMTQHRKCIILNDMGTGKTASALWAIDHMQREGLIRTALIIAPLSCLEAVWEKDLFTFTPHQGYAILDGTAAQRLKRVRESSAPLLITNHDAYRVGGLYQALADRDDIDLIVWDEATALKDGQTDRVKRLRELLAVTKARLWLMTGSPTPNAPTEAWSLGRLINPQTPDNPTGTPTSFVRFRDQTMKKITNFRWEPRSNASLVVRTILQPAIRFNKEDCISLPPVVYTEREAELTVEQRVAYKDMKLLFRAEGRDNRGQAHDVVAGNAAIKLSKLMQICSGSAYLPDGRTATFDMSDRLEVLEEVIEQAGAKVVVFVPFRHAMERMHDHMLKRGMTVGLMHGDVTGANRAALVRDFQQTPNPKVLLAHPRCASHGLTLTAADTVIWFGPPFSAEQYQQANERTNRPGQTRPVLIVHLYSTPEERKVFEILRKRKKLQEGLLEMYEELTQENEP